MEIKILPVENPYKNETGSKLDLWGIIYIKIEEHVLIDWQWDMFHLIEWFFEHENTLQKPFPKEYKQYAHLSLTEIEDLVASAITDDSDEYITEIISEELQRNFGNNLFYLRGTPTLRFSIGLDYNGFGEISFQNDVSKRYTVIKFNMEEFIFKMKSSINNFIKLWKEHFFSQAAYNRLLDELFSSKLEL